MLSDPKKKQMFDQGVDPNDEQSGGGHDFGGGGKIQDILQNPPLSAFFKACSISLSLSNMLTSARVKLTLIPPPSYCNSQVSTRTRSSRCSSAAEAWAEVASRAT